VHSEPADESHQAVSVGQFFFFELHHDHDKALQFSVSLVALLERTAVHQKLENKLADKLDVFMLHNHRCLLSVKCICLGLEQRTSLFRGFLHVVAG